MHTVPSSVQWATEACAGVGHGLCKNASSAAHLVQLNVRIPAVSGGKRQNDTLQLARAINYLALHDKQGC